MAVPVATTTITVERSSQDGTMDAIDLSEAVWSVIASGVRAVIGSPQRNARKSCASRLAVG